MCAMWPIAVAFALVWQTPGVPQVPRRDAPAPAMGTASISGRVVAGDTGAPLAGAEVFLEARAPSSGAGAAPRFERQTQQTDDGGRYGFTGLPAGRFALSASPPAHKEMYLPLDVSSLSDEPRLLIDLEDSETRRDADITLARGGALAGRVLDAADQPMAGIRVQADLRDQRTRQVMTPGRAQETDDHGRFRIYGLPPGDYYIEAHGMMMPGRPTGVPGSGRQAYVTTYYPGAANRSEASLVSLRAGEAIDGLDVRLLRTRAFKITGLVLDARGQPAAGARVSLSHDNEQLGSSVSQQAAGDGRFSFSRLVPGEYVLAATSNSGTWDHPGEGIAGVRVGVTAADVENVTLAMRRGVAVEGQVVTAGGTVPSFSPSGVTVMLTPSTDTPGVRTYQVALDDSWRFTADGLFAPAIVRLLGPLPQDWFLQTVLFGSRDVTDEAIEFGSDTQGQTLQLVLNNRPAALRGVVSDAAGRPVANDGVLVFPPDFGRRVSWTNRRRLVVSSEDGAYFLGTLPPGEYLVVAVNRPAASSAGSTLEVLVPLATHVILAEGERRTLDVTVVDIKRE